MDQPIDHTPLEEKHIPVQELEAWIAGDISGDRATEIAEHLTQCDMCSDILEGLLEFDDMEGISQKEQQLYQEFSQKNLRENRDKYNPGLLSGLNSLNTTLLIIAALLLATILFSIFYLMRKKSDTGNIDPEGANRIDTMLAYDPTIATRGEQLGYIPDSSAVDSTIDELMHSDPNIDYEYYDETEQTSHKYRPRHQEEIYVYHGPTSDYITDYGRPKARDEGHLTPQSSYYGYDTRQGTRSEDHTDETIQVGNQLLKVNKIVRKAQSYYTNKEYDEGIYYLDKYVRAVPEPIADLDYWLARMYAANGQMDYARYYLERIAGYSNPYQQRAQKMLGQQ